MALDDAELPYMLETLGESITLGATTTRGVVDRTQGPVGSPGEFPEQVSGSVVVHVKTGSLPGLEAGVTIVVGGTSYIVREQLQADDGAITRIDCVSLA